MNPTFWRGRRVLITGHTGFKGSWLSLWLQSLGADVVGYALTPPTEPNLFTLASVAAGMKSVIGEICDENHLRRVVHQFEPEIVFHMAAQAIVRESYIKPVETYATNVMGTVHLLNALREVKSVRAVVAVTSDKCYENRGWVWGYRENESMGGFDPYSSSKGCAEIAIKAFRSSFFNPHDYARHGVALASARAGNVIGGGDWAKDRLVPDIIRSLLRNERIQIRHPGAVRPWQHVLEPLHGYMILAERLHEDGPAYSEGWNFGPYESGIKTVAWIVEKLTSLWDAHGLWDRDQAVQPHEDNYLVLDCAKARSRLGWIPTLDLDTALNWIVAWTKAYQSGADMREVTESQVQTFMDVVRTPEILNLLPHGRLDLQAELGWKEKAHVLDLIHDSFMARSMDGRIGFWNRGAEQMYGWSKGEVIGRVSHTLLQTKFPSALEEIEGHLEQNGVWEGNLLHARKDGQRVSVRSRWVLTKESPNQSARVLEINSIRN